MLKHDDVKAVAEDFGAEVRKRDYVNRILAPTFVDDPTAWEMVVEVMEVVLHRRDLYIAHRSLLDLPDRP